MIDAQKLDMDLRLIMNFLRHSNESLHNKIFPENTASYAYILAFLCDNEDKIIYQRDIERQFDLSRSTVSTVLKELEADNLIERRLVLSDARLKRVVPTERARMINEICKNNMNNLLTGLLYGADQQQTDAFFEVLEIIKSNACKIRDNKSE